MQEMIRPLEGEEGEEKDGRKKTDQAKGKKNRPEDYIGNTKRVKGSCIALEHFGDLYTF